MSELMKSDQDGSGPGEPGPVSPDQIDWSFVRSLFVMDMQFENQPRKWTFKPCVVFTDDTWREVGGYGSASEARSRCASLGAIHDKPVRDWTRPAPPGLSEEITRAHIRAMQSVKDMHKDLTEDPEPAEGPAWGWGWEHTDHLFLEGASDEEFLASFDEMERGLISAWDDISPDEVRRAVSLAKNSAVTRWLLLHAANDKPSPKPEVEPA